MIDGDKLMCVNDQNQGNDSIIVKGDYVKKGTIYLFRGIASNNSGILLHGIHAGMWHTGEETGWDPSRFRKIVAACDRVKANKKEAAK